MFTASALAGYYLVGPRVVGGGNAPEEQAAVTEEAQPEAGSQASGVRREAPKAVPRLNIAISEETPVAAPRPERASQSHASPAQPSSAESALKPATAASSETKSSDQLYRVQVGVFTDEQAANQAAGLLRSKGEQVHITRSEVDGKEVFKVQAGLYTQKENADRHARQLEGKGVNSTVTEVEQKVSDPKPAETSSEPRDPEAE